MAYLLRASEANGLDSPRALATLEGNRWLDSMQQQPGAPRGPVAGMSVLNRPDVGRVPIRYWNVRRARWCSMCLQEGSGWSDQWMLALVVACPRHARTLSDTCPRCVAPVKWNRASVWRCQCDADLAAARSPAAGPGALAVAEQIAEAWEADAGLAKPGISTGAIAALQRAWVLGAYATSTGRKPQKLASLHDIQVAARVSEAAGRSLMDWPSGFVNLLKHVQRFHGLADSHRLTDRFGGLYREIYDRRKAEAYGELRSAFEQFIRGSWAGQLARRNTRLKSQVVADHPWVPVRVAAKQLHWKPARVREAVARGALRGHVTQLSSGRTTSVIHRDDLASLKNEARHWLTMSEVCAALRVGKKTVHAFIRSGRLPPMSGPTLDGQRVWRFRSSDVRRLVVSAGLPGG